MPRLRETSATSGTSMSWNVNTTVSSKRKKSAFVRSKPNTIGTWPSLKEELPKSRLIARRRRRDSRKRLCSRRRKYAFKSWPLKPRETPPESRGSRRPWRTPNARDVLQSPKTKLTVSAESARSQTKRNVTSSDSELKNWKTNDLRRFG